MRNRLLIATGFALVAVVVIAAAGPFHSQPSYEGPNAPVWIRQLQEDRFDKRAEALQAMSELGEQAVPGLVNALSTRDSSLRRLVIGAGRAFPFLRLRGANSAKIRAQAAFALGRIGVRAA